MSRGFPVTLRLLPLLALAWAPGAGARDICTVSQDPQFRGTSLVLECQSGTAIVAELGKSLCGGSAKEISVVGRPSADAEELDQKRTELLLGNPSYIAKVNGVPGREGYPLGAYEYGMAERVEEGGRYDDGFQFPDATTGFTTTCAPGYPDTKKWIFFCWDAPQGTPGCLGDRYEQDMGYPYFQDPICRWRLRGGGTYNPPKYTAGDFEEIEGGEDPPGQTPGLCEETRDYLNRWQYFDCLISVPTDDGPMCLCWGDRYICDDHVVIGSEYGICDAFPNHPNAQDCTGEECRCGGEARETQCKRTGVPPDWVGPDNLPYRSYYRKYQGSYERAALDTQVPEDKAQETDVPVACYGFYEEFDPKRRRASRGDYRCVIDMNVDERAETQQGKGEYLGPGGDAPLPAAEPFKEAVDSWWQLLPGGFAHLSPKEESLSVALAGYPNAIGIGTPQSTDPDAWNGWSIRSLVRDIDDTGPLGTVSRWWHKQQTAVNSLLTPPKLRLVHVPPWAMGLGSDQEIFGASSAASSADLWASPRERPLDQQIHAREDLVGQILSYIHHSLFAVEEAPLPVLVPDGSPSEFRARAQALCAWYITNNPGARDCAAASGRTRETIDRLEEYARRIDDVRQLRAQLTELVTELLQSQRAVLQPLYEWSEHNLSIYEDYQQQRDAVLALGQQWQGVARVYDEFHERSNAPWCMDHRFTTAIYSLLDPWLPPRSDEGNATQFPAGPGGPVFGPAETVGGDGEADPPAGALPSLELVPVLAQRDTVMDLSVFNSIRSPLVLPVLKPVQVRLHLEAFGPPAGTDDSAIPKLPPLPDIAPLLAAVDAAKAQLPTFCGPPSDSVTPDPDCPSVPSAQRAQKPDYWSDAELGAIAQTINEIGGVVAGMNDRYKTFWESLNPEGDERVEEEKDKLKCVAWDSSVCRHVEMDLLERFTRIGSRPAVLLAEDFKAVGTLRGFAGACLPDDETCQLLNPENVYPRGGWQLTTQASSGASSDAALTGVRTQLRNASMVVPVGSIDDETFPPYAADRGALQLIFETPASIDLTPSSSSSAAP